jgi:hypothetical protein
MGVVLQQSRYKPTRWTPQAIHCYFRGGVCKGCPFKVELESIDRCYTKQAVIELVRLYGRPTENQLLEQIGYRRCKGCGKIKKLDTEFYIDQISYCIECTKARDAEYRKKMKLLKGA